MSLLIYQIYFTKWFKDHSCLHLIMQLTYLTLLQRAPIIVRRYSIQQIYYFTLSYPVDYSFPKLAVKIHKFYAVHLTSVRSQTYTSSKQGVSIIHFRF